MGPSIDRYKAGVFEEFSSFSKRINPISIKIYKMLKQPI